MAALLFNPKSAKKKPKHSDTLYLNRPIRAIVSIEHFTPRKPKLGIQVHMILKKPGMATNTLK